MSVTIYDNPTRTYYITFINADDEEFNISPPNYLLLNFDGFEQGQVEIQSSKAPYQDGETYIDNLFAKKIITLEIALFGDNQQEVFDRRLIISRIFNSRLGMGKLRLQQVTGSTYDIDVITKSIQFGSVTSKYHNKAIIELIAPNPFWYDPTQVESIMVGFSGGFSFPFSFPFNLGTVGSEIEVANSGNIETPIMIYFYGEVIDPVITNETTDEEIIITQTINDGDILIVNTAFGEKSALILSGGEYVNAFEYVDPDSTFWKLAPGSNTIKYTVTSEGANAQCRIYYYHRYSGV
jgi:hypothetical protein